MRLPFRSLFLLVKSVSGIPLFRWDNHIYIYVYIYIDHLDPPNSAVPRVSAAGPPQECPPEITMRCSSAWRPLANKDFSSVPERPCRGDCAGREGNGKGNWHAKTIKQSMYYHGKLSYQLVFQANIKLVSYNTSLSAHLSIDRRPPWTLHRTARSLHIFTTFFTHLSKTYPLVI